MAAMTDTRRPRALVIDDDPHVRELWAEFLQVAGCDADGCDDGDDGLARFARGIYDVVVTDVMMPGLDGRAVARTIREADPHMEIILVTGDTEAEPLSEPGVTLLRKPIGLADFHAALAGCLARRADMGRAVTASLA